MRRFLLLFAAVALGLTSGEWLSRNFSFRYSLGKSIRHDELLALVNGRGIYAGQLSPNEKKNEALERAIDQAEVASGSINQPVKIAALDLQMEVLRWQFPNDAAWQRALTKAGSSPDELRKEFAETWRGAAWLEAKIAPKIQPNDAEVAGFYQTHSAFFQLPRRFRAAHIFLAAPDGYPDEAIDGKRALIGALALRLENGEDFAALAAETSEDEETKNRGGDLDYFAQERMLPEIFAAAQTSPVGLTSAPIRSRLGFHLLRVTEDLPATQLSLAQAKSEIVAELRNEKRRAAVAALIADISTRGRAFR